MITESEFMSGAAMDYKSFSGAPITATYVSAAPARVDIRDVNGRRLAAPIMAEHEARNFYAMATDPALSGQAAANA